MLKISATTLFVISATLSYPLAQYGGTSYFSVLFRLYATCLLSRLVYSCVLYPNLFSPLRHLPTVDGDSWWSYQSIRLYTEPNGFPQLDWIAKIPHNGLIRYRSALGAERIIPATPAALSEVLTTKSYEFKKPETTVAVIKQIGGKGLLLAEGDQHKRQRKTLLPAFAYRHVKDQYGLIWELSIHAVTSLTELVTTSSKTNQQPVIININEWASTLALDLIFVAGMGQSLDSIQNQDDTYTNLRRIYKSVFTSSRQDLIRFILRLWNAPDWLLSRLPLKKFVELDQAAKSLREICRQLIRQKKSDLKNELAAKTDKNILTVALSYGGFTEEELVEQLLTFLAAGHETTATALTWAVYILSKNPDMQTRLRDEIRSCLPSPTSPTSSSYSRIGSEDLAALIDNRMPYLHAVCQEVLRYFTPVPIISREAAVDTSISGIAIPAGTRITICPLATNRDASLWGGDAHIFNPNRYLSQPKQTHDDQFGEDGHSENADKYVGDRSNYATLTFSHGPRSCIGQSFAKSELALALAVFIGRFEFALADELFRDEKKIPLRRGPTMRPANGIPVKVALVEGW
ncbi:cytochrome P450 [Xylaria nigripes]|nr:cytochrome P450 [Xylaria nigripes]